MTSEHHVHAVDAGRKLVDVAKDRLAVLAISEMGEFVRAGGVFVDGAPGDINDQVQQGAVLTIDATALAELAEADRLTRPSSAPVTVCHEDDDLVVVDKPAGMHVHPMGEYRDDTLVGALLWHAGARPDAPWAAWRPRPTHRLDRGTSGLVLVAKRAEVQRAVDLLRQDGAVRRTYRADVVGHVEEDAGTIDAPIGVDPNDDRRRAVVAETDGGQHAVSHWRVVRRGAGTTQLELTLDTGRTHQLRVHLAHLGHPILGDVRYGGPPTDDVGIALRAVRLALPHPTTGAPFEVHAP